MCGAFVFLFVCVQVSVGEFLMRLSICFRRCRRMSASCKANTGQKSDVTHRWNTNQKQIRILKLVREEKVGPNRVGHSRKGGKGKGVGGSLQGQPLCCWCHAVCDGRRRWVHNDESNFDFQPIRTNFRNHWRPLFTWGVSKIHSECFSGANGVHHHTYVVCIETTVARSKKTGHKVCRITPTDRSDTNCRYN